MKHITTYRYKELIRSPLWKMKIAEQVMMLVACVVMAIHLLMAGWFFPEIRLLIGPQPDKRICLYLLVLCVGDLIAKLLSFSMPTAHIRSFLHINTPRATLKLSCYMIAVISLRSLWPSLFIVGVFARGVVGLADWEVICYGFIFLNISISNSLHAAALRASARRAPVRSFLLVATLAAFGAIIAVDQVGAGALLLFCALAITLVASATSFFQQTVRRWMYIDFLGEKKA